MENSGLPPRSVQDTEIDQLWGALRLLNCDPQRALRFLAANYRDVADVSWSRLVAEYLRLRKRSASQQRHLAYTLVNFGKSLPLEKAEAVSLITEADAMDFLDLWPSFPSFVALLFA